MFKWFKSILEKDLNELTNEELLDLGEEFTTDGDRALAILQSRQKELADLYKRAYSEFERKEYSATMVYINQYIALAEKYGAMIINAVYNLQIGVNKETKEPEEVLSVYDDAIAYYKQVQSREDVLRFERSKEYYMASLK